MDRARRQAEVVSRVSNVAHDVMALFTYELRAFAATVEHMRSAQAPDIQAQEKPSFEDCLYIRGWFDQYRGKLGERFYTFKMALNWLLQHGGKHIVETGSLREPGNWFGVGCSTYLFGEVVAKYGGHLWTCDISEQVIEAAQQHTQPFRHNITYVCSDSVEFLNGFDGGIDLLYLDSMDCSRGGDATAAQRHNHRELQAALPKLTDHAIVLLDDNRFRNGGKTRLSKQYLLDNGWICLFDWHQSLWTRRY